MKEMLCFNYDGFADFETFYSIKYAPKSTDLLQQLYFYYFSYFLIK